LKKITLLQWSNVVDKIKFYKNLSITSNDNNIVANYYTKYPELNVFKKFKKIIVWGYPLGSHTHSYIHGTWVKVFNFLQLPIAWYHDNSYPKDEDYSDCLFITEGFCDENIPIISSSTYFVHVAVNPEKYLSTGARMIDIRYYVDSINDTNYCYTYPTDTVKLNPDSDALYKIMPNDEDVAPKFNREVKNVPYEAIYMYWATDLLPHEFNYEDASATHEKVIYHIGTFDTNHPFFDMPKICEQFDISFIHKDPWITPVTYEENIRLMKTSYCCPDFRNYKGFDSTRVGYIPCRIFKAISYGHSGITNSLKVKELLGEHVEYISSIEEIIPVVERRKDDVEWRKEAMRYVAEKHTYINRVHDLALVLIRDRI